MTNAEEDGVVTINVFTVAPEEQDRLLALLTSATTGIVDKAPGFLSAKLHKSLDGTKVAMYAKWASHEDYLAMRSDKRPLPFLQEALTFSSFEPGVYMIVNNFEASVSG